MASPSVASYFNVRKRAAADDIINARNKVVRLDTDPSGGNSGGAQVNIDRNILAKNRLVDADLKVLNSDVGISAKPVVERPQTTATKRTASTRRTTKRMKSDAKESLNQPKIVRFTLGGTLSPRKNAPAEQSSPFQSIEKNQSTKKSASPNDGAQQSGSVAVVNKTLANAKKDLSYEEIKSKVNRSAKLDDLKAILSKRQQLEEQYNACINKRTAKAKTNATQAREGQSLKQFDTIELEVLSSPQKGFRTPTKTPIKESSSSSTKKASEDGLMSPKKSTPVRCLFSPTKVNPVPAYQKYQSLVETGTPTLQLPYKYRSLSEIFRCVDSICSMFFNRKETITFKKLKPAVQRMLRRNFTENHLAQIKYLYPDAYNFQQKKMLNPGSHTKYDYYQLVIIPNVQPVLAELKALATNENIVKSADAKLMNPQVMIKRQQTFNNLLLDRVKSEHDAFLKSLQPPLIIPKEKVRRWHQEFDLESCSDILPGELPQPPNIEKFSSAKEILSTARNLFNCATPMERAMDRYEEAKQAEASAAAAAAIDATKDDKTNKKTDSTTTAEKPAIENPVDKVLKGVPKSLLEKIRAKQAAKALEAMTRRPSQDAEASKYARLPELARYIRNIFVTENKGVLELDKVMAKLENSYRERMTKEVLRELLELMAKEAPRNWLTFHFIRRTDFIKINRHENLSEVIKALEQKAQEKAE